MSKLIPFFEVNGNRYEIKPTRYLMCEYDKIGENNTLSDEDKLNAVRLQELATEVKELAEKFAEIKEKHFADIANKELTAQYKAFKAEYKEAFDELAELEVKNGSSAKLQKATINALEQIAIKGLAEQYPNIDAKQTWCDYVDKVGNQNAGEWLIAMADCLFSVDKEEEDNSFLALVRAKQQGKLSRKK
jgi:hypothetical protein